MCIYPLTLKYFDKSSKSVVFHTVPCGKCIECERARCLEFALRACDEASLYEKNCFVTLTYNAAHLPVNETLVKKDVQNFLKRLRNYVGSFRYYLCGEYGSLKGRPHYHILFFGFDPDFSQATYLYSKHGIKYYRHPVLDKAWSLYHPPTSTQSHFFEPIGYVSYSRGITFQNAFYTAKYLQKRVKREGVEAPFTLCSTRPGIGFGVINDKMKETSCIYRNGKKYSLPKYYRKKLGLNVPLIVKSISKPFSRLPKHLYMSAETFYKKKEESYKNDIKFT